MAAAVDRDTGSCIQVQIDHPHFDVRIGCFVFGSVSFAFQLVLLGIFLSFFIIGGKKTLFVYPFCSFLDYR